MLPRRLLVIAMALVATSSMQQYASFLMAATDADEQGVPCFYFVRGIGVPIDLARAHRCMAREVRREGACRGNSPSLARLQHAVFLGAGLG